MSVRFAIGALLALAAPLEAQKPRARNLGANPGADRGDSALVSLRMVANEHLDPIFQATVQATEGAITSALLAAETTIGADSIKVTALPHARLRDILKQYGRLDK